MTGDSFSVHAGEPLAFFQRPQAPPEAYPDLRARYFELSSGGDRVPGRLLLPARGEGPFPLVLLQHGAGGSRESAYLDAAGGRWVRSGAAVASIDFPLHGARENRKLGLLLVQALLAHSETPTTRILEIQFARQAVRDLRRALDALQPLPEVDAERIAYAAFSLGTILGTPFCAVDPRPRAAALALGGGGFGPPEVDPAGYVERIAPRPILFVNAERDERIPRTAAEKLHAAAREPKQVLWFDSTHSGLRGEALKAMWRFLAPQLGIDPEGGSSRAGA